MNFTLHTRFPDSSIATEWNALLAESITNAPFLRYEYMQQWWKTRGGGEWQHASLALMTAREGDRLVGIAPLFHAVNRAGETALLLLGSIEISDQLDLIVRPGDLPNFLSACLTQLGSAYPG
jgi:hypothetical protein